MKKRTKIKDKDVLKCLMSLDLFSKTIHQNDVNSPEDLKQLCQQAEDLSHGLKPSS